MSKVNRMTIGGSLLVSIGFFAGKYDWPWWAGAICGTAFGIAILLECREE